MWSCLPVLIRKIQFLPLYEEDSLTKINMTFPAFGPQPVRGRVIRYSAEKHTRTSRTENGKEVIETSKASVFSIFTIPSALEDDLQPGHRNRHRLPETFQENFALQNMFIRGRRTGLFPLLNPRALQHLASKIWETGEQVNLRGHGAVDAVHFGANDIGEFFTTGFVAGENR